MSECNGGAIYRCPSCGATYIANDQPFDGWRCDHGPTFPRPAHRWGEFYENCAYDPAAFTTRAETNPVLERIGTLADYLGVGDGMLVAEWHVVMPDGSLQPALTWRATGEASA